MSIARLLSVAAQAARGGNSCISAARSGTPLLSKLTARTYNWNKPSFLFPLAFGLFSTASPSSSSGDGREVHVDKAADLHQSQSRSAGPPYRKWHPSRRAAQQQQQAPEDCNWRPKGAAQLPELVEEVFADAIEFMDGNQRQEVDKDTVYTASQLCHIGVDTYQDEADLSKAVRELLEPYLENCDAVDITEDFTNDIKPAWALGDPSDHPSNLFLIMEVQLGNDCTNYQFLSAGFHYLCFWKERFKSSNFRSTCCPAFLLEVLGPHVRLSAVTNLDGVVIFPLTPLLNLLPAHPDTDRLLMPVARMLAALRMGVRKLADADAASVHAPCTAPVYRDLPWPIRKNPRYHAATAVQLAARNPIYYVRRAGSGDGGEGRSVVVKLYRKYGLAAHQAWADLDLAPQILHRERLPAGWELLELEWLPGPEWQPLYMLTGGERIEALDAVEAALRVAHRETGMVHGDMRPPNCLVRRNTTAGEGALPWHVRFVDFEWAGREGEATYPAFLNPDIPWPRSVGHSMPLKREHDLELLLSCTADWYCGGR